MKPKVAVAISGGIDSLITAAILKKKFKDVIGFHFLTGYEPSYLRFDLKQSGLTILDLPANHPISHIKKQLDIPIKLVDCREYFQKTVVDYFVQSYFAGMTPNPCMICNPLIKFGAVFNVARQIGITYFATGHYARITKKKDNSYLIQKGTDTAKDQSYFLAFLPKEVLPFILFPLGTITKKAVQELAEQEKLTPVSTKESQDVCFIHNNDYNKFITSQPGFNDSPGEIINTNGQKIGVHQGLHRFTIGQRRGINCPASEPYYVLKIDMLQNRLIVGSKNDLYKTGLRIKNINWFIPVPEKPITVFVKIRYRHTAAKATLVPDSMDSATIQFHHPQMSITPGQGAVCYINDDLVAGGWIENE